MKKIVALLLFAVLGHQTWAQINSSGSTTYYGILPCADCPGIETVVTIFGNHTFRLQQVYLDRNQEKAIITDGVIKQVKKSLIFYDDKRIVLRANQLQQQLQVLDQEGKAITGKLATNYLLQTKKIRNKDGWKAAYHKGVDLIGMGTEPFWSIEIDREGMIQFSNPDISKPLRFAYLAPQINTREQVYLLNNGKDSGTVVFRQQVSSDGMSDDLYPHQVLLTLNQKQYKGVGVVLNEATPITGKWELSFISGPRMSLKGLFPNKTPMLMIDGGRSRFSGNNGCNMLNGKFIARKDSLQFDRNMVSTMMACTGQGEQLFNRLLLETNRYAITQQELVFYKDKAVLMRFRRIK